MPATKVIKSTSVETTRKPLEKPKQLKERDVHGAQRELKVPAVRKSRASSCPRYPDKCERRTGEQGTTLKTSCERRTRSSSTATKTTTNWSRINPDYRLPGKHAIVPSKCREMGACPGKMQQQGARDETSHKAFTVIPPNPKKRKEIQRKAEAELAALEELRLSRAMAYVSINPSSVGGCMSLEEVRLKQQQEMMQEAKRRQKLMKKVTEQC